MVTGKHHQCKFQSVKTILATSIFIGAGCSNPLQLAQGTFLNQTLPLCYLQLVAASCSCDILVPKMHFATCVVMNMKPYKTLYTVCLYIIFFYMYIYVLYIYIYRSHFNCNISNLSLTIKYSIKTFVNFGRV